MKGMAVHANIPPFTQNPHSCSQTGNPQFTLVHNIFDIYFNSFVLFEEVDSYHAGHCWEASRHLLSCEKIKKVVIHTTFCRRNKKSSCRLFNQLLASSCSYFKKCTDRKRSVPYSPFRRQRNLNPQVPFLFEILCKITVNLFLSFDYRKRWLHSFHLPARWVKTS